MIEGAGGVEVPKALFYAIIMFCTRRGTAVLKRPACLRERGLSPLPAENFQNASLYIIEETHAGPGSAVRSRPAGKGYRQ